MGSGFGNALPLFKASHRQPAWDTFAANVPRCNETIALGTPAPTTRPPKKSFRPGVLVSLDPGARGRTDVESQRESVQCFLPLILSLMKSLAATFIYSSLGRAVDFVDVCVPVIESDVAHMAAFLAMLTQLVKDDLVKALPIKLWDGKVGAEKIVYRV